MTFDWYPLDLLGNAVRDDTLLYLNYFSCDIISTSLYPNLKSDNRLNLAELKEEQFISSLSLEDVVPYKQLSIFIETKFTAWMMFLIASAVTSSPLGLWMVKSL